MVENFKGRILGHRTQSAGNVSNLEIKTCSLAKIAVILLVTEGISDVFYRFRPTPHS